MFSVNRILFLLFRFTGKIKINNMSVYCNPFLREETSETEGTLCQLLGEGGHFPLLCILLCFFISLRKGHSE